MSEKAIYMQIMRDYEKAQGKAKSELLKRKNEVYEKVREIAQIDEKLLKLSINATKSVLALGASDCSRGSVSELKDEATRLNAEKKLLLLENGFAEDYLTEKFACENCKDTGYINTEKCHCLKQKLINKYYELSNLKDTVLVENFDTFDFRYYSENVDERQGFSPRANMHRVYASCTDFVKTFKQKATNLLFYGDTGLGKTFLCNCIAKDVLDFGHTVLYVTAPRMFKAIEHHRFSEKTEESYEQMDMLFSVDLLIIDDLGSEFQTVVTGTELFDIINSRLIDKKSTVISTNLSLSDLQGSYSDRIVSRFFGCYKMIKFFGDDIRVKKKIEAFPKK